MSVLFRFRCLLIVVALGSLPLAAMAQTPKERQAVAEFVLETFDEGARAARRVGSAHQGQPEDVREALGAQRLAPSVKKAAEHVLAGRGWVEERWVKGDERGKVLQHETTTGGLSVVGLEEMSWVHVRRDLPAFAGATHWGSAEVGGWATVETRGKEWKMGDTNLPARQGPWPEGAEAVFARVKEDAEALLGTCAASACEAIAQKEIAWVHDTLALAKRRGIAPKLVDSEGTHVASWQLRLRDDAGRLRELKLRDIGVATLELSKPLSIEGRQTTRTKRGLVRREFSRAHFSFHRRVRVVKGL